MLPAAARSCLRLHVVTRHLTRGMSSEPEVLLERVRNAGVITLNRPRALNALNLNMIRLIYPQLKAWQDDPAVKLVIIKGAGEKAFCAGGDIRVVTDDAKAGGRLSNDFFYEEYKLNYLIGNCKVPYVALIDGITMGGGVGLSVHGRFRVATEKTLFAMPETAIGLFPDVGGGHFLPRLPGQLGVFLALTGARLKGADVAKAGVATHLIPKDQMPGLEAELVGSSSDDVGTVLDSWQDKCGVGKDVEFSLEQHRSDIARLFSGDTVEEIVAALEADGSEWAAKQASTIAKMSPTSLKVTLRQLREGATMDREECLRMEYRLSQHCMEDKDFYEGVRAVLVDKDNAPQWDPATLEGMTQDKLDWYFSPLSPDREWSPEGTLP